MRSRNAGIALGALSLIGLGVVIGVHTRPTPTSPTQPQTVANEAAAPDTHRALRDLLGTTADGSLRENSGQRAVFWVAHDFTHDQAKYHAVFFALKPLDASGELENCRSCAPHLAAVTYRLTGGQWQIAAKDDSIGRAGSYGEPPGPRFTAMMIGATPAIAVDIGGQSQGFSAAGVYLMGFRKGWHSLGQIQTAQANTEATECVQDRRCYAWQGTITALSTASYGMPDLAVTRKGTQEDEPGGRLMPAGTVVYEFMGTEYVEKGKAPPPPPPEPARAQPPAMQNTEPPQARQWYAADINFSRCIRSKSPGERIRIIQEYGRPARTKDLPNGGVEVIEQTSPATEEVWTYYPTEAACIAALPRSQSVPSRYN